MSRSFVCALIGIAMTLLAWYGPWAWPAWPALTALTLVFGKGDVWSELPFAGRAAVLVALIVINVGFWGLVAALSSRVAARFSAR